MPYTQTDEIFFRGRVFNNGSESQTGSKLNVTVNRGAQEVFNNTTSGVTINKLDTSIISLSQSFTPDDIATYSLTFSASSDEADQIPADNTLSTTFAVVDTVFARDDGVLTGLTRYSTNFYVGGDVDGSIAGTIYDCPKPGRIKSMSVYILNDINSIGASFKAVLYPLLPNGISTSPLLESEIIDINVAADMNKWHHLPFITDGELELIPEDGLSYIVGIQVFGVGPLNNDQLVVIGADRRTQQPLRTTYVNVASTGQWGFTENGQPLIRLNLEDPAQVSVNEVKANEIRLGQNIPNPAQQSSVIYYTISDFSAVSLDIHDISGKLIANHQLGNRGAGKHDFLLETSNYENGIYFYTLRTRYGSQTRKMIVSK